MTTIENKNTLAGKEEGVTPEGAAKRQKKESDGVPEKKNPKELGMLLDGHSLETVVEMKLSRFFDQLGGFYPENLYDLIIKKVEKPLIQQILVRTGGNQLQAAQILGINRNTLRKKIKLYGI